MQHFWDPEEPQLLAVEWSGCCWPPSVEEVERGGSCSPRRQSVLKVFVALLL